MYEHYSEFDSSHSNKVIVIFATRHYDLFIREELGNHKRNNFTEEQASHTATWLCVPCE